MPYAIADRVKETSTTTGTGTYSLAGAVSGFRTFVEGIGTGNTCPYIAEEGANWECGIGTVTDAAPDTLARTQILASSNAGAAVNWGAGTRTLYVGLLAKRPNPIVRELAAQQNNSTVTPSKVTGLDIVGLAPGVYQFTYYVIYQAAATTTGVRFDVNFTGTVTRFVWNQRWVIGTSAASTDAPDQDHVAAGAGVVSAFSSRAKGTAGRGTTLSVDTANADMLMIIEGIMVVTVAGDLQLYHGSEVAAQSSVMAGSQVQVYQAAAA